MSGDLGKEQSNLFYSKDFTEAHDTLLLQGKVKSVYDVKDNDDQVVIQYHDKELLPLQAMHFHLSQ